MANFSSSFPLGTRLPNNMSFMVNIKCSFVKSVTQKINSEHSIWTDGTDVDILGDPGAASQD